MKVAWDIETTGIKPFKEGNRILTAAMQFDYPGGNISGIPGSYQFNGMSVILNNKDNIVIGHNIISFDVPWWEAHVAPIKARLYDTRVAWSLVDETGESADLASLGERLCGIPKDSFKSKRKSLEDLPIAEVLAYNVRDVELTWAVYKAIDSLLQDAGLKELHTWLMEVGRVLSTMMVRGVTIDQEWVNAMLPKMVKESEALEFMLRLDLPDLFTHMNLASTKQLGVFLYGTEAMGLSPDADKKCNKHVYVSSMYTPIKKTTKGKICVDKHVLNQHIKDNEGTEIASWLTSLLQYRQHQKNISTYLEPLIGKQLGTDGRIHTSYNMGRGLLDNGRVGGASTGRLSSSDPNLQNIPRDKRIKGSFIASPGMVLGEADYSQIEIRGAAWYAEEEVLYSAFAKGRDIHTQTMALLEGISYADAEQGLSDGDVHLKEQRAMVKPVNFGVLYGVGPKGLQKILNQMGVDIPIWKCYDLIEGWFAAYPKITKWISDTKNNLVETGYVENPFGLRRRLPDAQSHVPWKRARALRQGVNALIQSMAGYVLFLGMQNIDKHLEHSNLLLTVHDSVLFEYDTSYWSPGSGEKALSQAVEQCAVISVNKDLKERFNIKEMPLAVDIKLGMERWGE